ncbi:MAG: B12-binding domain-containing radical SAM protein [Marinisporobacter sp.]|jgi:radical SAM superfamily enzyme YgiQ (UPF0313 family)|nr:B12-binding domain-containing radical SAM protein [Marinisporobacter sp.]
MKVCLIKASADSEFKEYKASMGGPPQNIFAVAAATPNNIELEMVDETIGKKVNFKTKADLIAIFFSTPDAIRGYKLARKFKELGKTVILGGLHPTLMVDEAEKYCDSVMVGEVENYWTKLLDDFQNSRLKKRYLSNEPVDLSKLHPYPKNLLNLRDYGGVWSVVVGRGCDNGCNYCVVNPFFKKYRFRPISDIVNEIKLSGAKIVELHADNLIADREYALELFKALVPLEIQWIGECTITVAEDDELLSWMIKSGLTDLLVGLETPCQEALDNIGKSFIKVDKLKGYINKIQGTGVRLDASFLFGFDEHHKDIFKKTLDFAIDVKIANCHSVILTPFPGTPFYNRIVNENRLLTRDYSKFDCTNAVYQPKHMTPQELEEGALWFDEQFEKAKRGKSVQTNVNFSSENTPSKKSSDLEMPNVDDVDISFKKPIKWKTILGITLVLCAIIFDMPIFFGVLYILWAILDIKSGYAYILEDVSRRDHKILYWIIVLMWLCSGIYVFTDALLNNWIKPMTTSEIYEYDDSVELGNFKVDGGYMIQDDDGKYIFVSDEKIEGNDKINSNKAHDIIKPTPEVERETIIHETEFKPNVENSSIYPEELPQVRFGNVIFMETVKKGDKAMNKYDVEDGFATEKFTYIQVEKATKENIENYIKLVEEANPTYKFYKKDSILINTALNNKKNKAVSTYYTNNGNGMIRIISHIKDGKLTGKVEICSGEFLKK